jgi:hypothetical protein
MSIAEIADNKWEAQAVKPPITNIAAISQILMMVALASIFIYLLQGTLQGIFGEKRETMADNIGKMTNEAAPAPAAK